MKNLILTGASDGLGKAFGQLCIKEGINVIALCRRKPDYECTFIETDLTNDSSMINACNLIKEKYNKFDAFVNCAGAMSFGNTKDISLYEEKNVFMVNSIAPIFLISQLYDLIIKNNADILNVVSIMGTLFDVELNSVIYSSTKWALRGASFNLEAEFKDTPCRVITFNPGGMNTNLFKKYDESLADMASEWMKPKDIADIMLYTLNLPKQVEITEINISRKPNYKV